MDERQESARLLKLSRTYAAGVNDETDYRQQRADVINACDADVNHGGVSRQLDSCQVEHASVTGVTKRRSNERSGRRSSAWSLWDMILLLAGASALCLLWVLLF